MAIFKLKIDLAKVDKAKLFNANSGAIYLDATLLTKDEDDQFGNCGMIVQDVSKADREAGMKGAILGNAKLFKSAAAAPVGNPIPTAKALPYVEDLPF
jgi:hypothetical protein